MSTILKNQSICSSTEEVGLQLCIRVPGLNIIPSRSKPGKNAENTARSEKKARLDLKKYYVVGDLGKEKV